MTDVIEIITTTNVVQEIVTGPPDVIEIITVGPPGATGPQGPQGQGTNSALVFIQDTAETVWTISHGLGFYPNVTVVDTLGRQTIGDLGWPSPNVVTVSFTVPLSGRAFLS